ncbi:hypothetical protein A1Q2_00417 [Trichosporon asahii var. asahii CBS 8904]|jgi:hypothetical protein|uniref:Uncharacterized protein n=2 Tax=Trichosporon asahii var. asahii TaxID=189963 RepID=K1W065_TRIAC|nr:hypothetical protein A1Q1_04765 [Trichosporon asahii var. asahii CBS 2479]EJT46588.1 hypothetical protein A1Q1_04765 [Trichosporon asahii var. asahii CBS 2479]EKD05187.1 hypothetical protein A1Q2_00417 [Trichosporon asahii var. asahii CBS 8904]
MRGLSSQAAPSLDPRFFPHITESILFFADYASLLSARGVCVSMCTLADKALSGDTIILKTGLRGRLLCEGPLGNLPFFHPRSKRALQLKAMASTQRVVITKTVSVTERLNSLLKALPATCHVRIEHGEVRDQGFCLPEIASLTITSLPVSSIPSDNCNCSRLWSRDWRHKAKQVLVECLAQKGTYYWDTPAFGRCQLIARALNAHVQLLELHSYEAHGFVADALSSRWRASFSHYDRVHHRNPGLAIVVRLKGPHNGGNSIADDFARSFEIDSSQVRVYSTQEQQ